MAGSRKTEFSTKTVARKAEKASEKAHQDFSGAFVTQSNKTCFDIDQDVVDVSVTQISKKPNKTPVSSTAPQYILEQT